MVTLMLVGCTIQIYEHDYWGNLCRNPHDYCQCPCKARSRTWRSAKRELSQPWQLYLSMEFMLVATRTSCIRAVTTWWACFAHVQIYVTPITYFIFSKEIHLPVLQPPKPKHSSQLLHMTFMVSYGAQHLNNTTFERMATWGHGTKISQPFLVPLKKGFEQLWCDPFPTFLIC